jgi:hypothetical protein
MAVAARSGAVRGRAARGGRLVRARALELSVRTICQTKQFVLNKQQKYFVAYA